MSGGALAAAARLRERIEAVGAGQSPALVMGVLNVTPDSFSDGGRFHSAAAALRHAGAMAEQGADIIDVGGESTRPGAAPVSEAEETDRVLPVIERILAQLDVAVSIDTSRPALMRAGVEAGAALINDVRALAAPGAVAAAASGPALVCLMHMQGSPATMQDAPHYDDPAAEVRDFLAARLAAAEAGGIAPERLLVDPGFGFGKTLQHNLDLLVKLHKLQNLGRPILVGLSRKSMLGGLTGRDVTSRLAGSVALATLAAERGAHIIRCHDVAETVDAVRVAAAVAATAR